MTPEELEQLQGLLERVSPEDILILEERKFDKNVGGGTDRDKIPASDFAGKNRSFPIVTPGDVADATVSIGRAGSDNYDAATLKANIIRIAKRKGKAFVAKLPDSWSASEALSDDDETGEALEGDIVDLVEKAVAADDTIDIKLISPGWGSSGYYPAEVLKRDGPIAFPVGTQMFLDHPTDAEKRERPEGSVKDLAAAIATAPVYQESGPAGPGLYAKAAVIPKYKELIDALAPHIGVSIRAPGTFAEGEAEGRKGRIVKAILNSPLHSAVDFVTKAGRGGQVLALMESWRDHDSPGNHDDQKTKNKPEGHSKENLNMDEMQKLQADLEEARTARVASEARVAELVAANEAMSAELGSLRESVALSEARALVDAEIGKTELHAITKTRLSENIVKMAKLGEDGKLDTKALSEAMAAEIARETEYVAKLTESGKVRDQGKSGGSDDAQAKLEESFVARYVSDGYSAEQAKKMAAIAAAGR